MWPKTEILALYNPVPLFLAKIIFKKSFLMRLTWFVIVKSHHYHRGGEFFYLLYNRVYFLVNQKPVSNHFTYVKEKRS